MSLADTGVEGHLGEVSALVALILLLPLGAIFDEELLTIPSVTWIINYRIIGPNQGMSFSFLSPADWMAGLLLSLPRFLFVRQIVRYYEGRTSMKRTLLIGLLGELNTLWYALLISLPALFIPGLRYVRLGVPIPFLLLIGWTWMAHHPPRQDAQSWLESR